MTPPAVSIIIPAHNAAATLGETLDSLRSQTMPHWEAIVVDNASTDNTAELARQYANTDSRFRCAAMPDLGVSRARNFGLTLARHDWILFLDADDWILPQHLQRLTAVVLEDPTVDAVHCGWARTGAEGGLRGEEYSPDRADLFPELGRTCVFAIHACIFRRALLEPAGGGFDENLRACEDWDLWLRIARTGARFRQVREVLALYRTRAGSASMDALRLVQDGFAVIDRAHAPDPRVLRPLPRHAKGLDPATKHPYRFLTMLWAAGLAIGAHQDPLPLLDLIDPTADAGIDPPGVAQCLHSSVLVGPARPLSSWAEHYEDYRPKINQLLEAVEQRLQRVGLAASARRHLESMILDQSGRPRPFRLGTVAALTVEVTAPFRDLEFEPGVERVHVVVLAEGDALGSIELPVHDQRISAEVLSDAVSARFAWDILGRYFRATVYASLDRERGSDGWTVRRGSHILATGLPGGEEPDPTALHTTIGWPLFLQEAWNLGGSAPTGFYHLTQAEHRLLRPPGDESEDGHVDIEIAEPLRNRRVRAPVANVTLTVAGVQVVNARLASQKGRLPASVLRVGLTLAAGFELCRAVVREAILGRPFTATGTLHERLAGAMRSRRKRAGTCWTSETGARASLPEPLRQTARTRWFWGARRGGPYGTSRSRRAHLPSSLYETVQALAQSSGEPIFKSDRSAGRPEQITYLPEIRWEAPPAPEVARPVQEHPPASYHGGYFEELFVSQADPWKYSSPYEQTKYEQTLALLPEGRFDRALELACAEGHFTVQLAPRVNRVLATDISPTALTRTSERCRDFSNIEYRLHDLARDPLPGRFDLIVCSEVLYYTGGRAGLRELARRLTKALLPGGYLVTAHANVQADAPDEPGFDWNVPFGAVAISEVFGSTPGLRLLRELRTPLYRIQLYQRQRSWRRLLDRHAPRITVLREQPTPLEPDVAAHARWPQAAQAANKVVTSLLPILMYHRVADDGPASLARYRVSPVAFAEQLQHLRDQGYTGATFEEWQTAMRTRQPLPGKRIMLTFDDGYRDFATHAWPLLKRFGFPALVFLPTGYIGGASDWDQTAGEPAPLLDWSELRHLDMQGVTFGGHTVSHRLLTSLSSDEIARELVQSRRELQEQLGEQILSLAYPFGDHDDVVRQVAGAAGYVFGVTCEGRPCCLDDDPLALPRLEVTGSMTLSQFRQLLGESTASTASTASATVDADSSSVAYAEAGA